MRKLAVLVALAAIGLAGCSNGNELTVRAKFTDVADLAPEAPVMMNDVRIGRVAEISLSGNEALVTMLINPGARVPQGVVARTRRTSLLGERIVDFEIPEDLPMSAPPLRDGAMISNTEVRPDLEDLVESGNNVISPIAAGEVATLVDEGAKGFGGRGEDLRNLLSNFRTIVHAYAGKTEEIRAVIESLNQLNTTIATRASAHGRAVINSERALTMLREESGRLQTAIRGLNRLSVGAAGILRDHTDEMSHFFSQMKVILGVLRSEQSSIAGFLKFAPLHNRNTQMVEYQEFNQILQDFVICGFNDDPQDPARRCRGHE